MTSRERVLRTIDHKCEGRIPFTFSPHNSLYVHGEPLLKLLNQFQCDFFNSSDLKIPTEEELKKEYDKTDIWGCRWQTKTYEHSGRIVYHPLEDWENFKNYKMPDVPRVTEKDIEKLKKFREQYPVWAGVEQFFQVMQNLRATEKLFMDFYLQPEEVQKFIDRMLAEYHLPAIEEQLKLEPDILGTGDDWGTQTQLLINPELWHQFFKPAYKKMCDMVHKAGAKVHFHTCGYTIEVLSGFIEAGVDIINPQMPTMDSREYGNAAREKITVMPDLGRQDVCINGTPDEVKRHILDMYGNLGTPEGGLIAYVPIEPQMPLENVRAMLETVSNYSH